MVRGITQLLYNENETQEDLIREQKKRQPENKSIKLHRWKWKLG